MQAQRPAHFGTGSPADHGRFDPRHLTFEEIGEFFVEPFADDQAEHSITKKFEPLVGGEAGIGSGSMCQRGTEQIEVVKTVLQRRLTLIEEFGGCGSRSR